MLTVYYSRHCKILRITKFRLKLKLLEVVLKLLQSELLPFLWIVLTYSTPLDVPHFSDKLSFSCQG